MEVRYGPFRPDSAGLNENFVLDCNNVVPNERGYGPTGGLTSATQALPADPQGSVTVLDAEGGGVTFAGTSTKLYQLAADQSWTDVSRLAGGDYATPVNIPWQFTQFKSLAIANNSVDVLQKFDVDVSPATTNFEPLGGSPPPAKYIGTVGQFLVLSNITGGTPVANRIQWSGISDPEEWSDVQKQSDFQDLDTGGPAGPIVSGETGYIIQRSVIRRMIYVGPPPIFQIEVMETGRGTEAPYSLVQTGRLAFFLGLDGFYALDTKAGQTIPIGDGKIDDYFRLDQRTRTDPFVLGGADPVNRLVFWAYISRNTAGDIPDKVIIYDWSKGEFGRGTYDILSISEFITQGFTLDQLGTFFGPLDTLPFSLDSPFWQAGKGTIGVFGPDRKLSNLTGKPKGSTIVSNDFVAPNNRRTHVNAVTPLGDAGVQTIRLGTRERADFNAPILWSDPAGMEDNGLCPVLGSGRYMRIEHQIPEGTDWSQVQGVDVQTRPAGKA